jgi:hypothetical protein
MTQDEALKLCLNNVGKDWQRILEDSLGEPVLAVEPANLFCEVCDALVMTANKTETDQISRAWNHGVFLCKRCESKLSLYHEGRYRRLGGEMRVSEESVLRWVARELTRKAKQIEHEEIT